MSLESNAYRRAWSAWLPGALPLLEAENYAEALAGFPRPPSDPIEFATAPAADQRRIALVTSAGAYDRRSQAPFVEDSAVGDNTPRFFPLDIADERIAFAHRHYDREHAEADREVVLPRRALRAAGATLTPTVMSYMGYNLDWPAFIEATIPQFVAQARYDGANCALLVPV
ncbi:MAG: hypothetical protein NVSMB64_03340 [Candidatus Velthaea sp.]